MHATLVSLFSCVDGHWFIDSSNYTISVPDRRYDWDLTYDRWSVNPGQKLQMDVIFHTQRDFRASRSNLVCPVCYNRLKNAFYGRYVTWWEPPTRLILLLTRSCADHIGVVRPVKRSCCEAVRLHDQPTKLLEHVKIPMTVRHMIGADFLVLGMYTSNERCALLMFCRQPDARAQAES